MFREDNVVVDDTRRSPVRTLIRHVVGHPRLWLWMVGLATVGVAAGLVRLELRTGGSTLHPPGARVVVDSEADALRFQDPRQIILLVSSRPGGAPVASADGFRFLKRLLRELRALPAANAAGILSLPGLSRSVDSSAGIVLGTFLDDVPDDGPAFDSLLSEVRGKRLADGLLLSRDGRYAAFYVPLVADRPVAALIDELETWRDEHQREPFELELTGPEVAEATLGRMVLRDLAVFVPVMVVVIATLLWLAVGNIGGVVMPLGEALLVMLWMLGLMGWTGCPVTLVTTILPVVLMAMAIADEVHLLERIQALAPAGTEPLHETVVTAMVELARPIAATSITTALGFLSFLSATMSPLRQFGLFAAFGIMFAMVLSFVWVPALIVALPRRWFVARARRRGPHHELAFARWAARHPGLALATGIALVVLAVPGIMRLRVQDSWIDNFAPDAPLVRTERDYNDAFWGSYRFDVVLDAAPEFFYTPDGAAFIEDFERLAATAPHVSGVLTYLDPLEEVAGALGASGPLSKRSWVELADATTLVEMSEDRLQLRALLTEGGEAARVRLFVRNADYQRTVELEDYLDRVVPPLAARYAAAYHYSGDLPVALAVVDSIVVNQLRSVGWAFLTNALALVLFFARGRDAFICMVPICAADALLFGGMGYAGMPLGIATTMFASLTAGVGVDFAIHLVERYRRERQSGSEHTTALVDTIEKSGRALGWNAVALAAGFLVLNLSSLKPNHSLGILLASAMIACYAATFVMLPKLLRLLRPAVMLLLLAACALAPAGAGAATASPCRSVEPDPAAAELMVKLEKAFRGDARIVRMHIRTRYREQHPLHDYAEKNPIEKTLWGVSNGNPDETWLLYVFSEPGRLAGTTLLLQDFADPRKADGTWLYLRSLDTFRKIETGGQRVMVPGTALTYDDARGFIPAEKYVFAFMPAEKRQAENDEALVLACPRDDQIREAVGYDSLRVVIDKTKSVVRHIAYDDLGGKPLKSYTLVREAKVAGRWLPTEVRSEHDVEGYVAQITYEHWPLAKAPSADLYRPDVTQEKFLPRLERLLTEAGLGKRIRKEIETANEVVRRSQEPIGGTPKAAESPAP